MSQDELLRIENLHVRYRTDDADIYAVNGIDLVVNKGRTLGLVGETGAGKTTTALSILRLLPQRIGEITEGRIWFDGEEMGSKRETELRAYRGGKISMIFQDPMTSLNPVIRVGDQVAEALELHNTAQASKEETAARVDEIFELVGIPRSRKSDYPHQFSGGMKQRVVIAVALACRPELLIADEPTTALDVTIQAQVLEMMKQLKENMGMAIILISHDLGVIAETCDDVAVMYAGKIIEQGTVEDIFLGDKHHPYTEGLFGSIPKLKDTSKRLHAIEGLMPDPAALPEGCMFHPRCPYCADKCRKVMPALVSMDSPTHSVRCHLFSEEGAK